jgi:deoxyadenosine/deoxycytidine kinase
VFDGLISAGKSTLIAKLPEWLGDAGGRPIIPVPEPVEEWVRGGHLAEFYAALETGGKAASDGSYIFQTYVHVTRIQAIRDAWDAAPSNAILLVERWPTTDRYVFMENLREIVGAVHMRRYETWWDTWAQLMPFHPDAFIYVRPSLAACQARRKLRGRKGEEGVTDEYQTALLNLHDQLYGIAGCAKTGEIIKECSIGSSRLCSTITRPATPGGEVPVKGTGPKRVRAFVLDTDADFSVAGDERNAVFEAVRSALFDEIPR